MANNKEKTPKNYDRWENTCVVFTNEPKKKSTKGTKKGK